jgi:CBS domain-containing protein
MYAFILFVIVVIVAVYFMRSRDKRATPLDRIFEAREAIHSVGPDTPVTECVRTMTAEKIGALIVMAGEGPDRRGSGACRPCRPVLTAATTAAP